MKIQDDKDEYYLSGEKLLEKIKNLEKVQNLKN